MPDSLSRVLIVGEHIFLPFSVEMHDFMYIFMLLYVHIFIWSNCLK